MAIKILNSDQKTDHHQERLLELEYLAQSTVVLNKRRNWTTDNQKSHDDEKYLFVTVFLQVIILIFYFYKQPCDYDKKESDLHERSVKRWNLLQRH